MVGEVRYRDLLVGPQRHTVPPKLSSESKELAERCAVSERGCACSISLKYRKFIRVQSKMKTILYAIERCLIVSPLM